MLNQSQPNDPVWLVVDDEVIPARMIAMRRDDSGSGPSGLRAKVSYIASWGKGVMDVYAELLFAEEDCKAAHDLAKGGDNAAA